MERRSRPAPARARESADHESAAPRRRSAIFRGSDDVIARAEAEADRAKARAAARQQANGEIRRLRVPVGESRQFIIVDEAPNFGRLEHALKDEHGKWGKVFCGCISDGDNCPVCKKEGREGYYALYFTIIDLHPFETKSGDLVEFSKKLLVVKQAQHKKFLRFFRKEGTLRGSLWESNRDGDKDSAIGNDIEFLEWVEEDELQTYTRSWKDKDGKSHTEVCHEPVDYEAMFPDQTADELRALVGGDPTPGSRASDDRALGRPNGRRPAARDTDDWDEPDDDRRYEDAAPARRGARTDDAPARTRGERTEAAARGRTRTQPPPADELDDVPPPRRTRRAPDPEEVQDDDLPFEPTRRAPVADLDDAPPARTRRTRAAAAPQDAPDDAGQDDAPDEAPAPRTRRARPEPEPDPAPEEGRSRRAVLRGRR